jgi:class 3 adenylate cyclase
MSERRSPVTNKREAADQVISIVQRGNLKSLETTLRKQWRLGQNIVLCWSQTDNGILVLLVPHYFLGNYSAQGETVDENSNEAFIRQLISGRRRMERDAFFEVAKRLGVSAAFIKLAEPLGEVEAVIDSVEQIIKRYGISYVSSRAVLLFDIADFSLYSPFEQASQLNSLSYSLNSAYNKLLTKGIEINFARTTTGDGYYVWNRDLSAVANQDLLHFLLLVIADNTMAREASKGNTVPVVRTAYHIGSHYELYQAEGVNPTVFSYIVGDVTIELARMVDLAQPGQIFVGDFQVEMLASAEDGESTVARNTLEFLAHCSAECEKLLGIQFGGEDIAALSCTPSKALNSDGNPMPRRFRLSDKHGLSRAAYNLEIQLETAGGRSWSLGLGDELLPARSAPADAKDQAAEDTISDDSVNALKKRSEKTVKEE